MIKIPVKEMNTQTHLVLPNRDALSKQWVMAFGCPAPRHVQSNFLNAALSWHRQISVGSSSVERTVSRLQRTLATKTTRQLLSPGTLLLREWQGHSHHVTVLVDGFEYKGKAHRSLTAITRLITGTSWSGPLFFGLRT